MTKRGASGHMVPGRRHRFGGGGGTQPPGQRPLARIARHKHHLGPGQGAKLHHQKPITPPPSTMTRSPARGAPRSTACRQQASGSARAACSGSVPAGRGQGTVGGNQRRLCQAPIAVHPMGPTAQCTGFTRPATAGRAAPAGDIGINRHQRAFGKIRACARRDDQAREFVPQRDRRAAAGNRPGTDAYPCRISPRPAPGPQPHPAGGQQGLPVQTATWPGA